MKIKMAFVGILSQINLLFGQLVLQLVWYIIKQLFTFNSVSVKVVDISGKDPPLFSSTSVNIVKYSYIFMLLCYH